MVFGRRVRRAAALLAAVGVLVTGAAAVAHADDPR
jgi:hypothetical protein